MSKRQEIKARRARLSPEQQARLQQRLRGTGITSFTSSHIAPAASQDRAPPSFAQQRQWFLWKLDPDSTAYHLGGVLIIHGQLDTEALTTSLQTLIARHASLRTVFREHNDGQIEQIVLPPEDSLVQQRFDLSDLPAQQRENQLAETVRQLQAQPFDLTRGPMVRAALLRLAADEFRLVIVMHHIVSDAQSTAILLQELGALYRAGGNPDAAGLAPLPVQYVDYAEWQHKLLDEPEGRRQLAWWQTQLQEAGPGVVLSTDHPRQVDGHYTAAHHEIELPEGLTKRIRQRAQAENCTLFVVLLAAFNALLYRHGGQEDVQIGIPIANRHHADIAGVVGFFVNTQVQRLQVDPRQSLQALLCQTRNHALDMQANQDVPFERLVEILQPERVLGQPPFFRTMFNHLSHRRGGLDSAWDGVALNWQDLPETAAQFELTLQSTEEADGNIYLTFSYAHELFEVLTIERMAGHYLALLQALAESPEQRLGEVELLTRQEQDQLRQWGVNETRYPDVQPVHRLFEQRAAETPEAAAVIFEDKTISYGELNARANRLAHRLIAEGIKPEAKVGIALERSPEMVVGLLGILKAGAAYVPLDPEYPAERLAYMVEDSGIELLLTQERVRGRIPAAEYMKVLTLEALEWEQTQIRIPGSETGGRKGNRDWSVANPEVAVHGENLAYVIYTSGSTGIPKGVAVSQGRFAEHVMISAAFSSLTPADRMLQFATLNFDGFIEQLFPPLVVGAGVVLRGPELWSAEEFMQAVQQQGITIADLPTAYWFGLLQSFVDKENQDYADLREVHIGGEAMPPEGVRLWRQTGPGYVRLLNTYGPTEAIVVASLQDCEPYVTGRRPIPLQMPIGTPLAGRRLHVVDEALNPVPAGVAGELLIGGDLLARGYLSKAALTAERFVADPFEDDGIKSGHEQGGEGGGRLYRTGDLVRWNAEGQLEYLGRIGHQVKIRGFRIELGEVEAQLLAQPEVREAVVVASEGPAGARLVGYVSAKADHEIDTTVLKERLGRVLPEYMVPSVLMELEALPLNANGKVDRKALPQLEATASQEYKPPQGEVEEQLAKIWAEVLGVERVGRRDNFFELGGQSLLALQIVAFLQSRHACRLPVRKLFEMPTIESLASWLVAEGFRLDETREKRLSQMNNLMDEFEV